MTDQELRALCETPIDCGDSSCAFAKARTGMRTNGGCRCLERSRPATSPYAVARVYQAVPRLLDRVAVLEKALAESRVTHIGMHGGCSSFCLNERGVREPCDCGAIDHNNRIDTALAGKEGA